MSNHYWNISRR